MIASNKVDIRRIFNLQQMFNRSMSHKSSDEGMILHVLHQIQIFVNLGQEFTDS